MRVKRLVVDPAPESERGTLEYAASCAAAREIVQIELTMREAEALVSGDSIVRDFFIHELRKHVN